MLNRLDINVGDLWWNTGCKIINQQIDTKIATLVKKSSTLGNRRTVLSNNLEIMEGQEKVLG